MSRCLCGNVDARDGGNGNILAEHEDEPVFRDGGRRCAAGMGCDDLQPGRSAAKRELMRLIKASRFRPGMADGEFGTAPILLRYYLPE